MGGESTGSVALRAETVSVGYGRSTVVRNASVLIRRGEISIIVGPNGSGKSTLLKGIVGVLRPSSGKVILSRGNGEEADITGTPPERASRLGIVYVPQLANVFPMLTIRENLILGLRRGRRHDHSAKLADVYSVFPDLKPAERRAAHTLSGGQRMMLALGRALMGEPEVVIVDEPSAGLSPRYREVVWGHLARLRDIGIAMLVVEQNTHAALQLGNYGYVLVSGEVRKEGPAASLLGDRELVELYIGRRSRG
jgi:branched-chain amino acid transport system ATP-binding protein